MHVFPFIIIGGLHHTEFLLLPKSLCFSQDKGILLTTYDIVRNNVKSLCGDFFCHDDRSADDTTWDYMILDEVDLIFSFS